MPSMVSCVCVCVRERERERKNIMSARVDMMSTNACPQLLSPPLAAPSTSRLAHLGRRPAGAGCRLAGREQAVQLIARRRRAAEGRRPACRVAEAAPSEAAAAQAGEQAHGGDTARGVRHGACHPGSGKFRDVGPLWARGGPRVRERRLRFLGRNVPASGDRESSSSLLLFSLARALLSPNYTCRQGSPSPSTSWARMATPASG